MSCSFLLQRRLTQFYVNTHILFHIIFHCDLSKDIEYSFLCYTVGPSVQFSCSVQLFVTSWTAKLQVSQSITNSQSLLRFMSIESMMSSSHLILCRPLLLPPSIFPSIRIFSNESALRIRWPKYWSFSVISVLPMTTQD